MTTAITGPDQAPPSAQPTAANPAKPAGSSDAARRARLRLLLPTTAGTGGPPVPARSVTDRILASGGGRGDPDLRVLTAPPNAFNRRARNTRSPVELPNQVPALDADFLEELQQELAGHAMATSTRRNYAGHQAAWERWCAQGDIDPGASNAHDVALHLTWYLLGLETPDGSGRDAGGGLIAAIATSTLHLRLAAIDKAFEADGRQRPGHDLEVRTLMQGVRRLFGISPTRAKAPVLLADLRLMLVVVREAQLRPLRDLVLVDGSTPRWRDAGSAGPPRLGGRRPVRK